jgi:uncharacterized protein YjdB
LEISASAGAAIYYSIDGSIPDPSKAGNGRVFKYSGAFTVENRTGKPNFLWTDEKIRNFYGVHNDPRNYMPQPETNEAGADVPKATIIRAIAVDSNNNRSAAATRTFFIGNDLTRYGNHPVISLVTDPANLIDVNYGIYVRGDSRNRWNPADSSIGGIYNFLQRGRDEWERPANFELFNSARQVTLADGVGIRIRGGWSRDRGQKSFNVFFRDEYGRNTLQNFPLIPGAVQINGQPVARYKSFMLRNGGNDTDYTKMYDVFMQDLVSDRSFTTQAWIPVIVYINGEYWGFYNLQERYSNQHIEYKYGVNRDNVMVWDNNEQDEGIPLDVPIYENMMSYKDKDMSGENNADYAVFCQLFDIQNFIDYFAAQIYVNNEDWPQNNFRLWRARTTGGSNPYNDGKWRWEMFDLDFTMGIYSGGSLTGQNNENPFHRVMSGGHANHPNNELFTALAKNPDFSRQFVITMMDLYNVNYHPNNYLPKLDVMATEYRPLMEQYRDRWGTGNIFDERIENARRFLHDVRGAMVYDYLPRYFGSGSSSVVNLGVNAQNLRDVTIRATSNNVSVTNVSIKINTVTPSLASGSWTGKYYSSIPITVTANTASGYTFNSWEVIGGTIEGSNTASTIKVKDFTGDVTITAKYNFQQSGTPVTDVTINQDNLTLITGSSDNLTALVTPNNATHSTVFWSSNNTQIATVDQSGKVTAVGTAGSATGTAIITAATANGTKDELTVTVNPFVDGVEIYSNDIKLEIGDTYKIESHVYSFSGSYEDIPNKNVIWSSSNTSVAMIAQDGTVTAIGNGTSTITARTADGGRTATIDVTVVARPELFNLANILQTLNEGFIDNTWEAFDDVFNGFLYNASGEGAATYEIINDNGVKKLKVSVFERWGPGLWISNDVDFQAFDKLELKGTIVSGTGIELDINEGEQDDWWYLLQNWRKSWEGDFSDSLILSDYETGKIQRRGGISLKAQGVEPYDGIAPTAISIFIIEQIRVSGFRD